MSKIDETITQYAYVIDCLRTLRRIEQSGSCNGCSNKDCGYRPEWGQSVRYNCPFYKGSEEE